MLPSVRRTVAEAGVVTGRFLAANGTPAADTAGGRSQYAHQSPDYASADLITLTSGTTTVVDDQLLWDPVS
ncbi:hypothetical protein [Symbioplanes lichenis]|uniref:hypothetical protein n=1 Tax=Symbioplanes lichenis TaxID=1629072 RepID=UPI002738B7FF|nr:hypothetical protein [Actinoplanes lichenis]